MPFRMQRCQAIVGGFGMRELVLFLCIFAMRELVGFLLALFSNSSACILSGATTIAGVLHMLYGVYILRRCFVYDMVLSCIVCTCFVGCACVHVRPKPVSVLSRNVFHTKLGETKSHVLYGLRHCEKRRATGAHRPLLLLRLAKLVKRHEDTLAMRRRTHNIMPDEAAKIEGVHSRACTQMRHIASASSEESNVPALPVDD